LKPRFRKYIESFHFLVFFALFQTIGFADNSWLKDDWKTALAQAKQNKQIIIADFYGIWCPPCLQQDANVFKNPQFIEAAKPFVKLRIDVDQPVNWDAIKKYDIKVFPTVLYLDADGSVLHRVAGLQNIRGYLKQLHELSTRGSVNSQTDSDLAAETHETKLKSAENYVELGDALQKSIKIFPDSFRTIYRFSTLAELSSELKEEKKSMEWTRKSVELAERLFRTARASIPDDYDFVYIYETLSASYKKLGQASESTKYAKMAQKEWKEKSNDLKEQGAALQYAWSCGGLGQHKEAERVFKEIIKKNPKDYTPLFSYARYLKSQKKTKQSLKYFSDAFEKSYGDTRMRIAKSYGEALEEANDRDKARDLVLKTYREFAQYPATILERSRNFEPLKKYAQSLEMAGTTPQK